MAAIKGALRPRLRSGQRAAATTARAAEAQTATTEWTTRGSAAMGDDADRRGDALSARGANAANRLRCVPVTASRDGNDSVRYYAYVDTCPGGRCAAAGSRTALMAPRRIHLAAKGHSKRIG